MNIRNERIEILALIDSCRLKYTLASSDVERLDWLMQMKAYLDILIKLYGGK